MHLVARRALSVLALGAIALPACAPRRDAAAPERALDRAPATTVTTAATTTTAPAPATASTAPPPPPTAPPTTAPRALAGVPAFTAEPYRGLGTWIDVYDWSRTYGRGALVTGADVDAMVDAGVQTLFVQVARWDAPGELVDPDLLVPLVRRARARGLHVVAWYLPTLVDPDADLRRLLAAARLGVDGLAVDIESKVVPDAPVRARRLVALATALRRRLPGRVLGGIVLPPVVLDVINPAYWPSFPWRALAPSFDVWLPMAYWTNRAAASGWRDGYRYTVENVTRVREHLGIAGAPVHVIGGIGDRTVAADVGGLRRGAIEHGALGASLYDWRTTAADLWPELRSLRISR